MNFKHALAAFYCSLLFLPQVSKSQSKVEQYLIVGTYTRPNTKNPSEGIYVYKFNTNTGDFSAVSKATGIKNPSFLTVSPDQKFVYAVTETSDGSITAYSFDKKSGNLTKLNTHTQGIWITHTAPMRI
jgi:6-phosphogluconolactonase